HDGKVLVTVGADGAVKLWDAATGKELSSLDLPIVPALGVLAPDGSWLAAVSGDMSPKVWDVTTGKEVSTLDGTARVQALAFSPNGEVLASGSTGGTVRLWNARSGKILRRFRGATGADSWSVVSPQEGWAASAASWAIPYDQSIAISPNGKLLACSTGESVIRLWDVSSGKEVRVLSDSGGQVGIVGFSPEGKQLL